MKPMPYPISPDDPLRRISQLESELAKANDFHRKCQQDYADLLAANARLIASADQWKSEAESAHADCRKLMAENARLHEELPRFKKAIEPLMQEADEDWEDFCKIIKQQNDELSALREALRPFAGAGSRIRADETDDRIWNPKLSVGDYRRAARAMEKTT